MKARHIYNFSLTMLLVALQLPMALVMSAAPAPVPGKTGAKSPGTAQTKNSAQPSEAEIPQSSFTLPVTAKDGKDPFFPSSTRPYSSGAVVRPTTAPKLAPVEFILNGISPNPEKPLAMINGRTFGNNEEGDVPTAAGRAHIRCVEIKSDSAIIEFRGERRELKLRKGL